MNAEMCKNLPNSTHKFVFINGGGNVCVFAGNLSHGGDFSTQVGLATNQYLSLNEPYVNGVFCKLNLMNPRCFDGENRLYKSYIFKEKR